MVRVAGLGKGAGWILEPTVSIDEAAVEFGTEISETAWNNIRAAFHRHGRRLDALGGTRANENPNDARGWGRRKKHAAGALSAALKGLDSIDRDFLGEVQELDCIGTSGGLHEYDLQKRLGHVLDEILLVLTVVERTEPQPIEIPSEAESRQILAYDVFTALKSHGASLSNGWALAAGEPSYADLTGFERLAELLKIHEGGTPRATAKWLREALAQKR